MDKKITITGCGWLGLPLGKSLIRKGWSIKGTTTSPEKLDELSSLKIEPYLVKWPVTAEIPSDLFASQFLVLNIPPGRRDPQVATLYPDIIDSILKYVINSTIKKVIFISSTSVYGNDHELLTEDMTTIPKSASGQSLLLAEDRIKTSGLDWVILRLGGLAGPKRHPGRFLSGRKGLKSGNQVINYLHLDDAIGVIEYLLKGVYYNQIYNVVSPVHPFKSVFYRAMTEQLGLEPPVFSDKATMFKREVSVNKLVTETGYKFKYPDPMFFEY